MTHGHVPSQLKPTHLARRAILYVRQSSKRQVLENIGSLEHQRGQLRHLVAFGYPREQIDVIEDDLGLSGMRPDRPGYRRMLHAVEQHGIGVIAVSEISRGGREAIAWFLLFNACKDFDTLVVINGRVHDMRDRNDRVMLELAAILAQNDNELRSETFANAREAKVARGITVSAPPTCYLRDSKTGSWSIDPTPGVLEAIQTIFVVFLAQRTIRKTVIVLRERGIQLPCKRRHGQIEWRAATLGRVRWILSNAAYVGRYTWGRTRVDPTLGRMRCGAPRKRRASANEWKTIENHHPAIVSGAQFEEAQALLTNNATYRGRSNKGHSSALLPSRILCALHGYRLALHFGNPSREAERRAHTYMCDGGYTNGAEKWCHYLSGACIDLAVKKAVFAHVAPLQLDILRQACEQAELERRSERQRRQGELSRLEQRVSHLRYRYEQVDSNNRLVKADCERELERALAELQATQQGAATQDEVALDPKAIEELKEIAEDLPALFDAPTTSNADRAELVQTVIDKVIVEREEDGIAHLRLLWADGTANTLVEAPLPAHLQRRASNLTEKGLGPSEIARVFNSEGFRNRRGNPFTKIAVHAAVRRERNMQRAIQAIRQLIQERTAHGEPLMPEELHSLVRANGLRRSKARLLLEQHLTQLGTPSA
jgi:DNA invertase Pin-like site-specific DNA recombinase